MTNFNFRTFVMNENKVYLAKEIGDVLNSAQELPDEVNKIGTRNTKATKDTNTRTHKTQLQ